MPSRSRDGTLGFGAPSLLRIFNFFVGFYVFPLRFSFGIPGDFVFFVFEFWVILGPFPGDCRDLLASPAPGVAGNGFSAKKDGQFRGRGSDPCPGDPIRGHFPFLDERSFSFGFPSFLLGPRRPQEVL